MTTESVCKERMAPGISSLCLNVCPYNQWPLYFICSHDPLVTQKNSAKNFSIIIQLLPKMWAKSMTNDKAIGEAISHYHKIDTCVAVKRIGKYKGEQ